MPVESDRSPLMQAGREQESLGADEPARSGEAADVPARRKLTVVEFVALAIIVGALVLFFFAGAALWATLILGIVALLTWRWRRVGRLRGTAQVLFAYCALTLIINSLGIAYPYSNIFVLTGLLGLFFFSGLGWSAMFLGPGKTKEWFKPAVIVSVVLAGAILAIHFLKPGLVGENPTPAEWPIDVILMIGIGYAVFSAMMEESIYRGLMIAFIKRELDGRFALVLQAAVFGALHYKVGFPSMLTGSLLALAWGLVAGWVTDKADSLYPAMTMHFLIVLILFYVLAFFS